MALYSMEKHSPAFSALNRDLKGNPELLLKAQSLGLFASYYNEPLHNLHLEVDRMLLKLVYENVRKANFDQGGYWIGSTWLFKEVKL